MKTIMTIRTTFHKSDFTCERSCFELTEESPLLYSAGLDINFKEFNSSLTVDYVVYNRANNTQEVFFKDYFTHFSDYKTAFLVEGFVERKNV